MERLRYRMVIAEVLIIVGNGVEAGNLALSDTEQLSTRSKHTLQKVGDGGNILEVRTQLVAATCWKAVAICCPASAHVNIMMGMAPATLPRGAA
jgi:hypothetical protein